MSIGGNDVRFGDIVAGCLLPGSCAERREVWLDNVTALGPELTKGYSLLRDTFDPDGDGSTAIVVMPYPLVLTEDTCAGSPLDASEHEFIYEFTTVLNQQLAASAAQAGVHFFADGQFAFEGHRLCEDGDRAINLIGLQPTDGPLLDRLNPGSWIHNSMHPNPLGHRLTAAALTGWLNDRGILGAPSPVPDPSATTELLGVRTARPYAVAPSTLAELRAAAERRMRLRATRLVCHAYRRVRRAIGGAGGAAVPGAGGGRRSDGHDLCDGRAGQLGVADADRRRRRHEHGLGASRRPRSRTAGCS